MEKNKLYTELYTLSTKNLVNKHVENLEINKRMFCEEIIKITLKEKMPRFVLTF